MSQDFDRRPIRPNGLEVRRRRHERGWSPRQLVEAVGRAHQRSTGLNETITPHQLMGIEEHNESIPYETLCLVAGGLDCDPVEILLEEI